MAKSKRPLSPEQKAALLERLAKGRAAKAAKKQNFGPVLEAVVENAFERPAGPAGLLPAETMERIRAEACARVEKEMRQLAAADLKKLEEKTLEDETLALRRAMGLTNHLDDLVTFTVNLPPFAKMISLNVGMEEQKHFHHGFTYTERRAVYDVVREQVARGWDAERRAGNPNLRFYDQRFSGTMNTLLHEQLNPDGSFAARQTSINGLTGAVTNAPVNPTEVDNRVRG